MIIKDLYHRFIPIKLREKVYHFLLFFIDKKKYDRIRFYRMHDVEYGPDNPDKHFFVVRRASKATGLLACYVCALGHMIDIDDKVQTGKLIPVMDMFSEHYDLVHNKEDGVMNVNAWEYYFKRFSEYSMDDVLHSKKVTLSKGYEVESALQFFYDNEINKELISKYLPIHNRYFHLRDNLVEKYDKAVLELFNGKRVLGTNIREGYMVLAHGRDNKEKSYHGQYIKGHPVQPDIDELCDQLAERMKAWNCDYLFAEFQTTYVEKKLRNRFGDKFLCSDHKRIVVNELVLDEYSVAALNQKENYSRVENNIDYLKSIYLLSKCTSLYAGKSSGTVVASFWNNCEYEHMEIINKGRY